MQANHGIQIANLNTTAAVQAGLVVAANAHRMDGFSDGRPVSMQSLPLSESGCLKRPEVSDPTEAIPAEGTTRYPGSRRGRTWRLDQRQLPEAVWAMLVLSRSMCG